MRRDYSRMTREDREKLREYNREAQRRRRERILSGELVPKPRPPKLKTGEAPVYHYTDPSARALPEMLAEARARRAFYRGLTGEAFNDPPPGLSALDKMSPEQRQKVLNPTYAIPEVFRW